MCKAKARRIDKSGEFYSKEQILENADYLKSMGFEDKAWDYLKYNLGKAFNKREIEALQRRFIKQ